jgi:probable phosphoglycerate mutase
MAHEGHTRLLLIRHGESVVTVRGVLGGAESCEGLSALGRRQAEALRDRFGSGHEPPVDAVWASTLPRAIETAEIVRPALAGLAVLLDADLEELRPGSADGVPFSDFKDRFGELDWEGKPHTPFAPGGESRATFFHRVDLAIHRLVDDHRGQTVAVFCHGGVVDVALRALLDLPRRGHFDLWTLNCSITELVVDDREPRRGRWRLVRYNDSAHLAGLPAETTRSG